MPSHSENRAMPYSARQMFDLVADVARYPDFLPWNSAARIRARKPGPRPGTELLEADLVISFKVFREKFGSRVVLDPGLTRVETEGLPAVVARHQRARRAERAALGVLGLPLWVAREEDASALVTAAILGQPLDFAAGPPALRAAADPAVGAFGRPVIRFNHTGARSRPLAMAEGIVALADALRVPSPRIDMALDAAGAA